MRFGSIWLNRASRAGSGPRRWGRPEWVPSDAALAAVACETRGTVAAATAEADRNRRRLGPFEPGTSVLSMPRIKNASSAVSSYYQHLLPKLRGRSGAPARVERAEPDAVHVGHRRPSRGRY